MEEILHQLRLVVSAIIYRVLYIPGGARFQPSTVVPWIRHGEWIRTFKWMMKFAFMNLAVCISPIWVGWFCHQNFQVPKMEVLIRLFWGWGFPYIGLTYSLYRWGFLHFRYLIFVDDFGLTNMFWILVGNHQLEEGLLSSSFFYKKTRHGVNKKQDKPSKTLIRPRTRSSIND